MIDEPRYSAYALQKAKEVVEQIHRDTASHARALIDELTLDSVRYGGTFEELLSETSDRAVAITTYALFDDVLLEVVKQHLDPETPGGVDSLLNPSAFLGTCSNRLKLVVALRWISKQSFQDVNVLRNVRNRFAHHVDTKSFEDRSIAGYVSSLSDNFLAEQPFQSKVRRHQFIFRSIGIFQRFVMEIAVWPFAMKLRVDPRFILGGDEWPRNIYYMLGAMERLTKAMSEQDAKDNPAAEDR
jgi:DNA-binding MltR family transcriptional regulator